MESCQNPKIDDTDVKQELFSRLEFSFLSGRAKAAASSSLILLVEGEGGGAAEPLAFYVIKRIIF